jgi:hypothetical protein
MMADADPNSLASFTEFDWSEVALRACRQSADGSPATCPACRAEALTAAWHLVEILTRKASVDLRCSSCAASHSLTMALPPDVPGFFPWERLPLLDQATRPELEALAARILKYASKIPAAAFTTHPLWARATWSATTYQWHPTSQAPPVMGLVFDNAEPANGIFRDAERQMNHTDRFEEIRISIIEDGVETQGSRPGYSVHISPDPEGLAAHATVEDLVVDPQIVPFLGQWNRHYPVPGAPALLPRFKDEFAKHNEFLLAPVTRRADGQLYADPKLGIIKNTIHFRRLSEITEPDDPDAMALLLPQLITPPTSA